MLSGANLSGTKFIGANLRGANLRGANLIAADLDSANLDSANLSGTKFIGANLSGANLIAADLGAAELGGANLDAAALDSADLNRTDLVDAQLRNAQLRGANLHGANLDRANLGGADLSGADLRGASIGRAHLGGATLSYALLGTTLFRGVDLTPLIDAESPVRHDGPSTVDYSSILLSLRSPRLKDFLVRTGMPEVFVDYMVDIALSLDTDVFKMLRSTFISYGGPDEAFARKLYEALHRNGVTTFFFPEHAVPGKKVGRTMREGVNQYDRVILICSKASLIRPGVLAEIEHTLSREDRDGGASYFIPILLDDYVFSDDWKPPNADVKLVLKERVAADFRGADTDDAKFQAGLQRLIGALRMTTV